MEKSIALCNEYSPIFAIHSFCCETASNFQEEFFFLSQSEIFKFLKLSTPLTDFLSDNQPKGKLTNKSIKKSKAVLKNKFKLEESCMYVNINFKSCKNTLKKVIYGEKY